MSPVLPADPVERARALGWYWFRFYLPRGWEVTGYGLNSEQGRVDLSDRYGYRGQINWRRCKQRPDEVHVLSELHRAAVAERESRRAGALRALVNERVGDFQLAYDLPGDPCQASTYLEEEKMLVQWFWPEHDPEKLKTQWKPILESFSPNHGDPREWMFFGLHLSLPPDFTLEELAPNPANVRAMFRNKKNLHVTMRRWGLPDTLLRDRPMEEYFRGLMNHLHSRIVTTRTFKLNGHEAVEFGFERRGQVGYEKLTGRWWSGQAVLWLNREEKRLYAFEQIGPQRAGRLEMSDVANP